MTLVSWEESSNGNPVATDVYGDVICTLFRNGYGAWSVVVNVDDPHLGPRPHYSGKHFVTIEEARAHAEQLLEIRHTLEPSPARNDTGVTAWHKQAKQCNGASTYGRHYGSKRASIKQAKSGKWFYIISSGASHSAPVGWFASHQEAMAICDLKHLTR